MITRKHLFNTVEILIVAGLLFIIFLTVPHVLIHEGVHYAVGLCDSNVDHMDIVLYGTDIVLYCTDGTVLGTSSSYVVYYLKNSTKGMILSWNDNELLASTVSNAIIYVCIAIVFVRYVIHRKGKW